MTLFLGVVLRMNLRVLIWAAMVPVCSSCRPFAMFFTWFFDGSSPGIASFRVFLFPLLFAYCPSSLSSSRLMLSFSCCSSYSCAVPRAVLCVVLHFVICAFICVVPRVISRVVPDIFFCALFLASFLASFFAYFVVSLLRYCFCRFLE